MRPSSAAARSGDDVAGEARGEPSAQVRRKLVRAGEHEPVAARLEHESRRAAERIARGLSERVEGLAEGERRAEHLGDPVEAPLHLGLALALAEALGVVKREGREAGEGVEELEVLLVEAAVLPRADAEHAADLAQPRDRRVHDLGEHLVVLRRRRRLGAREIALEDRATGGEHLLEGALGDDLAADVPLRHARARPRSGASSGARRRPSSRRRRRRAAGRPR